MSENVQRILDKTVNANIVKELRYLGVDDDVSHLTHEEKETLRNKLRMIKRCEEQRNTNMNLGDAK